jgi:hypothetical protein
VTRRCEQSVEEGRRVIIGVDNDVCCDVLRLSGLVRFRKSEKRKTSLDFRPKRFAVVYDVVYVSDDVNITRDRVCMHDINV